MRFSNGETEIELDNENTFNIALRAGFQPVSEVEEAKKETKEENKTVYKCKKCEFETDNKGELLAHYRTTHPKKDGD